MKLKSEKVNEYFNLKRTVEQAERNESFWRNAFIECPTDMHDHFKGQLKLAYAHVDATEQALRDFLLNDDNFEKVV